jgi:hypothetical protein
MISSKDDEWVVRFTRFLCHLHTNVKLSQKLTSSECWEHSHFEPQQWMCPLTQHNVTFETTSVNELF